MADDILNAGESVYVQQVCDNLVLIDPNKITSSDGHSIEERLVRHEDLVIYINLVARVIPRSKLIVGKGASDTGVKIDLFNGEINFLKPVGKKSLDSDWTEGFTDPSVNKIRRHEDVTEKGETFISKTIDNKNDWQGFGIKGIEIKISSSFIPEVTINFVDIRGKTLFEQAETNTPYTAFFHLPYPQFDLTVKGYYGQAVKYQLALISFQANFDANTGDYNITASFIGNHIALLRDINLQQAMLAPYMYPTTKLVSTAVEEQSKGLGRKIMDEVYNIYKKLKLIDEDFPHLTIFELITKVETFTDNLKKNFAKVDLQFTNDQKIYEEKLKNFYQAIFGTNGWKQNFLEPENSPDNETLDMTIGSSTDSGGKKIQAIAYRLLNTTEEGIEEAESKLRYIIDGYKKILEENNTFGADKGRGSVNLVKDFRLENQRARSNNANNINEIPEKGYYVLEDTPKSFGGVFTRVLEEFEKNFNEIQEEVTEKLNKVFKESLTIDPTIRNLTAIIMAGVDTYLRLLDRVHELAFEQRNNEDRIKVIITDKKSYPDTVKGEHTVFPWPQYYEFDDQDNQLVLKYPGAAGSLSMTKAYNKELWPEVEFIEEYTKAVTFRRNEIKTPIANDAKFIELSPISVREFPFSNVAYSIKTKISILWDILDRAEDFTNYVGVVGYELQKPAQLADIMLEAANNDSKNLENSIKETLPLLEFFKDNTLDYDSLLVQLETLSPDDYKLYKNAHINTSYINNRVNEQIGLLKGTNFGLYPQSVVKENYTNNGEYVKYKNLYLENKKTKEGFFDFYPFNTTNSGLLLKLADGDTANVGTNFFDIDELTIPAQTNVYATENHKLFFSNLNWESDKYGNFGIVTNSDQLGVIKTYTTKYNWIEHYDTIERDILLQPLTEGINNTSDLLQCVSMLNTPWFANAIYKGFIQEGIATSSPYAEAAYLFLNSLPLSSTLEKVIKSFDSKNQYGGYTAQVIKQLAAYHDLPYAFILKIGSLWWNYKNAPANKADGPFGGLGAGDGGTMGNDGDIRCNEWYVDAPHANGQGWYDYSYNGNILPGLNTTEITLGFWPRLIDAVHKIITDKNVLNPVGNWTPVPDVQLNFVNAFQLEMQREDDLTFEKDGISYNFYTTFSDSVNIGTAGLSELDPNVDPYYILYPSAGGLVNTDLSFMGDNINTAGFDGSARFLWAGAGYGAFDVKEPMTQTGAGGYGAIYGRVPKTNYFKTINSDLPEQEAWNINLTDLNDNNTNYTDFTELLSVFPTQVLDEFERQFLNFSEPTNKDASLVEGRFTEFKSIFKDLMVIKKSEVEAETATPTTEEIAKSQYTKFLSVCRIFLNESVIYKHGSVNGLDIVVNPVNTPSTTDTTTTKSLIYYLLDYGTLKTDLPLPKFDNSVTAPTQNFKNDIALWVLPRLEVGGNSTFNRITDICFDFFKNYDVSHILVLQFAPILKLYVTSTEQNSAGGNVGLDKATFTTALTNILKAMDSTIKEYVNKLFKSISKVDLFKALNETDKGNDTNDERPKIVADNLKLELYQVFKTFNDKWISGTKVQGEDTNSDRKSPTTIPSYNTVMERFMFLDRGNRDIGSEAIIDIYIFLGLDTPFTSEPSTSVKQTVAGFMSHICSVNGFNFIPLPSYINFYNMEGNNTQAQGDTMFGTFKEVDATKSSPKYLCQYVGPPSTSLDIKSFNYGYNNDSFILNRVNPNPLCGPIPNTEEERQLSNKIMAFAVDFGIPNQQIFESVALDQSEFPNTSEAFRITEDLGKMASGSKVSTNSLNLFNLYKSRSYKCQVTAMGNALIQPTTYFQLRYVPMFSGPYLIMDVSHSISPNDMQTTFTGVRVGVTSLPKVTDLLTTIQEKLIKHLDQIEGVVQTNQGVKDLDEFNLTEQEIENEVVDSESDISSLSFPLQDPLDLSKIQTPGADQAFWALRKGGRHHKGIDYSRKLEFQSEDISIVASVSGIITYINTGCVPRKSKKDNTVTGNLCGGVGYQGYGNCLIIDKVLIKSTDVSAWVEGAISRYQFRFAHLKEKTMTTFTKGEGISKGTKIGIMGTTGNSDGVHLHYEIRKYVINKKLGEDEKFLNPNNFSSDYLKVEKTA